MSKKTLAQREGSGFHMEVEAKAKAQREAANHETMAFVMETHLVKANAELTTLRAEVVRLKGEGRRDWDLAHELATCGHPRANWQDPNYPESHKNYDPKTRTSKPPMEYRCIACEERDRLRAERDILKKDMEDLVGRLRLSSKCASDFQAERDEARMEFGKTNELSHEYYLELQSAKALTREAAGLLEEGEARRIQIREALDKLEPRDDVELPLRIRNILCEIVGLTRKDKSAAFLAKLKKEAP